MTANPNSLRVSYVLQNVGGVDLASETGDSVPIKYTLQGLRKAGHQVTCLMLKGRSVVQFDDISQPEKASIAAAGLTGEKPFLFLESGIRRAQRELNLPYFALFDALRFYEACSRALPRSNLCHEHNGLFCAGAALACARLALPYVLTFSADPLFELELVGDPLRGLHKLVAVWEAKLSFRVANRILCVSEPAKQQLVDVWKVDPEKIVVMPNGVDPELFKPLKSDSSFRRRLAIEDAPVVGFVGGFRSWHGVDLLVESFAQVLAEFPQARLVLVGDGPVRPDLERLIRKLELGRSVILAGLMPHNQIPEMLATFDVAVLPYPRLPRELWFSPLKLYEYMAAGKAIVAAGSGQIVEVIQHDVNGVLVKSGDVGELTQAIVGLLRDPAKRSRLGKLAREQAIERHSWDMYIKRLEGIYSEVLQECENGGSVKIRPAKTAGVPLR